MFTVCFLFSLRLYLSRIHSSIAICLFQPRHRCWQRLRYKKHRGGESCFDETFGQKTSILGRWTRHLRSFSKRNGMDRTWKILFRDLPADLPSAWIWDQFMTLQLHLWGTETEWENPNRDFWIKNPSDFFGPLSYEVGKSPRADQGWLGSTFRRPLQALLLFSQRPGPVWISCGKTKRVFSMFLGEPPNRRFVWDLMWKNKPCLS